MIKRCVLVRMRELFALASFECDTSSITSSQFGGGPVHDNFSKKNLD